MPITCDSKRNQLLLTSSLGEKGIAHSGLVWSVDLSDGAVSKPNPTGQEKIVVKRFGRESVFLPKRDLVMIGYHLGWTEGRKNRVPFYDVASNRWLVADFPEREFFYRQGEGASVDLGLIYDGPRDLAWAVMCRLQSPQDRQVIRMDEKPSLTPLE